MNAQIHVRQDAPRLGRDRGDLPGQRAPVRVAKDEDVGTAQAGSPQCSQRILGILNMAVEEVLRVVDDLAAGTLQKGQAFVDDAEVLLGRRTQDLTHVKGR